MNFQTLYLKGKEGQNKGIPTGLSKLNKAIRGIQQKAIYGIAGGPKSGKTTFADFAFVISPYEYMWQTQQLDDVEWIYYSFEIDRIKKEFKFAAHYFFRDYQIFNITHKGKTYGMSSDYLMGKLLDDDEQIIPVSPDHEAKLIQIYKTRIIPMFGEYDKEGNQISKGKINFITHKENPTGIRNFLLTLAKQNGTFKTSTYNVEEEVNGKMKMVTKEKVIGYVPNNPKKTTMIVTDHLRKLPRERNFTMKENVDKYLEYQVELRDMCGFTFVDIIHTNRNVGAVDRMKFAGEFIYPTGDDLKDTGNLSEDCDVLFTVFNANDEKYNLVKHFGLELVNFPNYRSVHIVESRDTECPAHIQTNMFGGVNYFEEININN